MGNVFDARDILAFPGGSNSSDTLVAGVHFNLTALDFWNYTLFSNGTLSNGSSCFLTFAPYTPKLLFPNGTFINSTSCYSPINPIGTRAKIGIGFAVGYAVALFFVMMNLRKHGRLFLPSEKRFRPIGRRWQWYWGILICVAAFVSLFTNIDVDRYYLPELPIVLTSFFWYLLQMCTMALVWEAVRHWGSWMERQFIDPNPFALGEDGRRYKFELLIPLVFYLFLWLNFFLVVPRAWGNIEKQRSPDQIVGIAEPNATDIRFKIAAFLLLASWIVTVVSLRHSIKHYLPRNRGIFNRAVGIVSSAPPRLMILLVLSLAMIAYQALCAWEFQWSVLKVDGDHLPIYLGGYTPPLLILFIQNLYGFVAPNEDRELIRQRRLRGAEQDRELGIVHKPAWWRRVNGDYIPDGESMRDRIARNVREVGGGRATTRGIDQAMANRDHDMEAAQRAAAANGESVEMGPISRQSTAASSLYGGSSSRPGPGAGSSRPPQFETYAGKSDRRRTERTMAVVASMLFPGEGRPTPDERRSELMQEGPPPYADAAAESARGRTRQQSAASAPGASTRSTSAGTLVSLSGQPQQVRSMLDI
ncbi:uncharacterized protein SPSK_01615 [Sporothrix schenckii 1099-18]|uniref:Uncharacterized protein n=2 Tax=Sporothrix schenckii TaxID=29908 RepID=U7PIE7_SPOS1|nr:uncharacterized protein SPSK_01615 [Sporothrix schenckii 1099-18]ERS95317.1 hypothetical protein HMPREF1624_08195 [Sporothrix schenckii ATCC 58251]KJR87574.1 hypothetical protein SPSK_01615 [Sporothrix schenckii 1099-18]